MGRCNEIESLKSRIHFAKRLLQNEKIPLLIHRVLEGNSVSEGEISEDEYTQEIILIIDYIWNIWTHKNEDNVSSSIGHDIVHISYDVLEFLYCFSDIPKDQRLLALFGGLSHDFGRIDEIHANEIPGAMDFKDDSVQTHALYSALQVLSIGRKVRDIVGKNIQGKEKTTQNENDIRAFIKKVAFAAFNHSGKNHSDPVTHHVQTFDRLAGILGSREFMRNITCDMQVRGIRMYPDSRLDYSQGFPLFNNIPPEKFETAQEVKDSWTNLFHYIEMPMRNIFPLSNHTATIRANEMRRESGIILRCLSGGVETSLYQQTFAPEIAVYDKGEENKSLFPKSLLPKEIWQAIQSGYTDEEKGEMEKLDGLEIKELLDLALRQQAPNISKKDQDILLSLISRDITSENEQAIKETFLYVCAVQNIRRKAEKQFIQDCVNNPDIPQIYRYLALKLQETPLFG